MEKVLVFGHSGLLGRYVIETLKHTFHVVGKSFDTDGFDLTNESAVVECIKNESPYAIVNCAAFTNVEACEEENSYRKALKINAEVPGMLANLCKKENIHFVHISTDYIFNDNSAKGYDESYLNFNPMNAYGETKLTGEQAVIETFGGLEESNFIIQDPKAYVIRTQWLFGPGAQNFIAKITKYANEKDELKVVDDEYGCPTFVGDLAGHISFLLKELPVGGIYHGISSNMCSRYEFAKEILRLQNIKTPVKPTKLADFDRKAHIVNYSILKNTKFKKQRTWQEMLSEYFQSQNS